MATWPTRPASLLLAVALLTGCVSNVHVPLGQLSAEPEPTLAPEADRSQPIPAFELPDERLEVHNQTVERLSRRGHEVRHLSFPASGPNGQPGDRVEALWETMGRPERITYRYKHRTAFYAMTPLGLDTMRREIYRFLDPVAE